MCSGLKAVLASAGGRNSELTGRVYSASSSGVPSRRLFSVGPIAPLAFRLPRAGEV